jgi:type III restriction enzyme
MSINLANYQLSAIEKLNEGMASNKRDIVLKSCTGSGKTVILTHFMREYCRSNANMVFVWLTPGKGNLAEQSKAKMDRHIHGAQTKLLYEIMTSGFEANDCCFINWEKLTKKGNNALKDGERTNFIEYIEKAHDNGNSFVIIVDESHQNDTIKANEIIEYFETDKIIRSSATPKGYKDAFMVEVPEVDVIAEGLIKKLLIINENFSQRIEVSDQVAFLLDKAVAKQQELHAALIRRDADVNPLIVIQLPNNSDLLLSHVETYLESKGITYENRQLAVWLSDKKQNDDDIDEPNAEPIVIIIKQAVATGWDCPRAHILVKLRDNMSETFEIQTIGRIRRMPEQKHYESDLLDSCYLYTLDEKFTESVKQHLGKDALDASKLYIKSEHRSFTIISEYKTDVPFPRDAALALKVLAKHFETAYCVRSKAKENKSRLEVVGYVFSDSIVDETKSGAVATLSREQFALLNTINITQKLDTHKHGREYHHSAAEIGLKLTLEYSTINTILQRLFCVNNDSPLNIVALSVREFYAFVINNKERLKQEFFEAMSSNDDKAFQLTLAQRITEKPIAFPQEFLFTYDSTAKSQDIMNKNVYRGYRVSAEIRSTSERLFEKYCETSEKILWFYKNGDKGPEYFSIVYTDNLGKQKSFYPDYIVGAVDGSVWIIETKGGFSKTGDSEDIDRFTSKKFDVLKAYTNKYTAKNLKGGIVRQDKQSFELCICSDTYSEDIKSDCWQLLKIIL